MAHELNHRVLPPLGGWAWVVNWAKILVVVNVGDRSIVSDLSRHVLVRHDSSVAGGRLSRYVVECSGCRAGPLYRGRRMLSVLRDMP
ncbi:MAG: hypothetical protein M3460_00810 [Actinomycetota bacterium]|nr:hypothetical protein [Actinomycetota bacterium]